MRHPYDAVGTGAAELGSVYDCTVVCAGPSRGVVIEYITNMVAVAQGTGAELLFLIELKDSSSFMTDVDPTRSSELASVCKQNGSLCAADSRQLDGRLAGTRMPSRCLADLIISR